MDKLFREFAILLAGTILAVVLLFVVGSLSKKFKINWLTKFLTQPSEQGRPPGWIVFAAGALLLILTLVWYSLPTEQQSAFRQFIVGP